MYWNDLNARMTCPSTTHYYVCNKVKSPFKQFLMRSLCAGIQNAHGLGGTGWAMTEFSWDVKYAGLQVLATKVCT